MSPDHRIVPRHLFEARVLIRLSRGGQKLSVHGWVRDLSEGGLAAFVAEQFAIGEAVSLILSLPGSGKQMIEARVARRVGTQYGFQFTALSSEQRSAIRKAVGRQPAISCLGGK